MKHQTKRLHLVEIWTVFSLRQQGEFTGISLFFLISQNFVRNVDMLGFAGSNEYGILIKGQFTFKDYGSSQFTLRIKYSFARLIFANLFGIKLRSQNTLAIPAFTSLSFTLTLVILRL